MLYHEFEHMTDLLDGYFISTAYATDIHCFETMVFPAEKGLVVACKELNANHILDVEFYDAYQEFTKALQKKVEELVADAREDIGISKDD